MDGTTVTMPDTQENQAAYPQQPGLGFPIARLVVFCLACGTVIDAALGRYQGKKTGENALVRTLTEAFTPGDVLLADRYFSGIWTSPTSSSMAWTWHQRHCDLRRGRRVGTERSRRHLDEVAAAVLDGRKNLRGHAGLVGYPRGARAHRGAPRWWPFGDWVQIFQGERMTAALLDRLTHKCHIFEMNGESYRFRESMKAKKAAKASK